jgi:hypothetical protein
VAAAKSAIGGRYLSSDPLFGPFAKLARLALSFALVHAVLATVDLDAGGDEIGAVAQANARLIDATPEETDAAVTTVCNVLKHPLRCNRV